MGADRRIYRRLPDLGENIAHNLMEVYIWRSFSKSYIWCSLGIALRLSGWALWIILARVEMNLGSERIALHGLVKSTRGCFSMPYSSTKCRSSSQMLAACGAQCLLEKAWSIAEIILLLVYPCFIRCTKICRRSWSDNDIWYPHWLSIVSGKKFSASPDDVFYRGKFEANRYTHVTLYSDQMFCEGCSICCILGKSGDWSIRSYITHCGALQP